MIKFWKLPIPLLLLSVLLLLLLQLVELAVAFKYLSLQKVSVLTTIPAKKFYRFLYRYPNLKKTENNLKWIIGRLSKTTSSKVTLLAESSILLKTRMVSAFFIFTFQRKSEKFLVNQLFYYSFCQHIPNEISFVYKNKKKIYFTGFVRLKFIDSTKIPKIYEPVESLHGYASPMSEVSDSDYTTITELRTPRLLDILHGVDRRRDSLPKSYFAQRKVKRWILLKSSKFERIHWV